MATVMFSSTVKSLKSRMFWKVRAMPSSTIWWGFLPSMDLPRR